MCRGNRKRDVTTMVTYSHATTPLGQSERAYYLSYFINGNPLVHAKTKNNKTFNKRKNRALLSLRRSQKHYDIFSNNVLRKNITQKQLRLETIEIA